MDENDGQGQPVTAEWLKANTRIRGWFAFLVFSIGLGGLVSLGSSVLTYCTSEYNGSVLCGMADILQGVELAVLAAWAIYLLIQRRPSAIFWTRFYCVLVVLLNVCELLSSDGQPQGKIAPRGLSMAIIWLLYLAFSKQVKEVFPCRYCHAGAGSWIGAVLLVLAIPVGVFVGSRDMVAGYVRNIEVRQSDLPEGKLTDGHVVFDHPDGWAFGMDKSDCGVCCIFTNDKASDICLQSGIVQDDSAESFNKIVDECTDPQLVRFSHRTVRYSKDEINCHVCYFRVEEYDIEDSEPLYFHVACMFDRASGKVVVVFGGADAVENPVIKHLLESIQFKHS